MTERLAETGEARCPPHYWVITEPEGQGQQWCCCWCGLVRQEQSTPSDVKVPRWGRRWRPGK